MTSWKATVPSRGEVVLVELHPTRGSEIRKSRPCLIVSPDELNSNLRTIIVAPMTTGGYAYPFRPACRFGGKAGRVALDQLRTSIANGCVSGLVFSVRRIRRPSSLCLRKFLNSPSHVSTERAACHILLYAITRSSPLTAATMPQVKQVKQLEELRRPLFSCVGAYYGYFASCNTWPALSPAHPAGIATSFNHKR